MSHDTLEPRGVRPHDDPLPGPWVSSVRSLRFSLSAAFRSGKGTKMTPPALLSFPLFLSPGGEPRKPPGSSGRRAHGIVEGLPAPAGGEGTESLSVPWVRPQQAHAGSGRLVVPRARAPPPVAVWPRLFREGETLPPKPRARSRPRAWRLTPGYWGIVASAPRTWEGVA